MRFSAILITLSLSGCAASTVPAPIHFKMPQQAGPAIDGVELAVLCELAERIGTDYLAAGIAEDEAQELQQKRRYLTLLNSEGVSCRGQTEVLDLPFVSDPERRLVSTWGGYDQDGIKDGWGSCLADTSRAPGDRVVFCEVSAPAASLSNAPALPEFDPLPGGAPAPTYRVPDAPIETSRPPEALGEGELSDDTAQPGDRETSDVETLAPAPPESAYRPVPPANGAPLDLNVTPESVTP